MEENEELKKMFESNEKILEHLKQFEFLPQVKLGIIIHDMNDDIYNISNELLDNPFEIKKTKKFVNLLEQFKKLLEDFKKEEM